MTEYIIEYNHPDGYEEHIYIYSDDPIQAINNLVINHNIDLSDVIGLKKNKEL